MADNKYKLQFKLSNGETINAGEIVAPQGPKGDKGDSADIPYSSSTPFMDGVGSVGSANTVARGDHRHPSDTSRQEKLVSGENIKTINGQSVLGSGDIPISGGGTIDADTLNGLLSSGNGITIVNDIANDKAEINVDPRFIQFGVSTLDINPIGEASEVYITDEPSTGYYEFASEHAGEIRYNANASNDTMVLQSGAKGNVKTLFGNQSIYGSGNIDLYNHSLVITANATNISALKVLIRFTSSSNTKIDSLTDLYTACSKFGEMEASGYVMSGGGVSPVYSVLCNSGDGVHYIDLPNSSTSGIAWTAMAGVIITDTVTIV